MDVSFDLDSNFFAGNMFPVDNSIDTKLPPGGGLGGLLGNNSGRIMDTRDRSIVGNNNAGPVQLGLNPQITNLNQLPLSGAQPISEERMNSLNRSIIGNGFYDLKPVIRLLNIMIILLFLYVNQLYIINKGQRQNLLWYFEKQL